MEMHYKKGRLPKVSAKSKTALHRFQVFTVLSQFDIQEYTKYPELLYIVLIEYI